MIAMISQPMNGKTDDEIIETRKRAVAVLEKKGYVTVNNLFSDKWHNEKERLSEQGIIQIPIYYLSKSIERMSQCHAVYFCKGWQDARGCRIEHETAKAYGLDIIYEEA